MMPWHDGSRQDVFGPVLVPPAPVESWEPVHDDRVVQAAERGLSATLAPAVFLTFALAQLPVPANAWAPTYPDRVDPPAALDASQQRAQFKAEIPQPAAPDLSWSPRYVDWLPLPDVRAAWPLTTVLDPAPRAEAPSLSWRGRYADAAEGPAGLHASSQRAYFRPEHPLAPSPERAWAPIYPDVLFAPGRVSDPPAVVWAAFTPTAVDQLAWRPLAPDAIDRLPLTPPPAFFKSPLPQPAAPDVSWRPAYPDWLPQPDVRSRWPQTIVLDPLERPTFPELSWGGIYPAEARGLDVRDALPPSTFKAEIPQPAAPDLSWVAVITDLTRLPDSQAPVVFRALLPPAAVPVEAFGWRGSYPDVLFRRLPAPPPALFRAVIPQPAAPVLSWRGSYPDFARPTTSLDAASQRATFLPEVPQPTAPLLAWHPLYGSPGGRRVRVAPSGLVPPKTAV